MTHSDVRSVSDWTSSNEQVIPVLHSSIHSLSATSQSSASLHMRALCCWCACRLQSSSESPIVKCRIQRRRLKSAVAGSLVMLPSFSSHSIKRLVRWCIVQMLAAALKPGAAQFTQASLMGGS